MARALLWARVSTTDQETDNQLLELRTWCERVGHTIVREVVLEESASTGAHRLYLRDVERAAHRREFDVLVVWALDRLTREGPEATLRAFRRLEHAGVTVISFQEPWTASLGEARDLVLAVVGWVAQMESRRRSERIKLGLARRQAAGLPIGRQPGARDRRPRRRSGYHARWEQERDQT